MKRYSLLVVLPSVFIVLFGCAEEIRRGEMTYVQRTEELPGYTVYVRDAETPKPTRTYKIKSTHASKVFHTGSGQKKSVDKKENKKNIISPLYYYRSSNPVRLTRVRLRRF